MMPRGAGQRQYTHALRRGLRTRGSAAVPIPSRRVTQKGGSPEFVQLCLPPHPRKEFLTHDALHLVQT